MDEKSANNLGSKLCVSWVSYFAGHKGVDRMLKQPPEQINEFWKEAARQIFAVHVRNPRNNIQANLSCVDFVPKTETPDF